jgi:acyl-CoA reductase-like NAD-dependent aldehyde dehydrogenase
MSLAASYPYYLGNTPEAPNQDLEVVDKFSGEVATRVALADDAVIDRAIGMAVQATEAMAGQAAYERKAVLDHCVDRFRERYEELAMALCIEAGKPIKDARGEVTRLIDTFQIASEESVRIGGEVLPSISVPEPGATGGFGSAFPSVLAHLSPPSISPSISQHTKLRLRWRWAAPSS